MARVNPHRLAATFATLTLFAFSAWFFASDQLTDIQRLAGRAARESAIFDTAAQRSTTYSAVRNEAMENCRNVKSPTGTPRNSANDSSQDYLDRLMREACEDKILYGTDGNLERAYTKQLWIKTFEVAVTVIIFVGGAALAAYGSFFIVQFIARYWWPWLFGR